MYVGHCLFFQPGQVCYTIDWGLKDAYIRTKCVETFIYQPSCNDRPFYNYSTKFYLSDVDEHFEIEISMTRSTPPSSIRERPTPNK